MKFLCFISLLAVILALANFAWAEEEILEKSVKSSDVAVEPNTLTELDAGVKNDGDLVRTTRQFRTFGFGRPFFGGGFYRPRPYYGGFYRPYYGGFYRPRPYYGGFYRPYYGGYYGGFYG